MLGAGLAHDPLLPGLARRAGASPAVIAVFGERQAGASHKISAHWASIAETVGFCAVRLQVPLN